MSSDIDIAIFDDDDDEANSLFWIAPNASSEGANKVQLVVAASVLYNSGAYSVKRSQRIVNPEKLQRRSAIYIIYIIYNII